MANFQQVFGDGPICEYADSYCEYEGDVEVTCGKFKHGYLFCHGKCKDYEPKDYPKTPAATKEVSE